MIHEAAIGKIAGEQILKLCTLGLTEEEAEAKIVGGLFAVSFRNGVQIALIVEKTGLTSPPAAAIIQPLREWKDNLRRYGRRRQYGQRPKQHFYRI